MWDIGINSWTISDLLHTHPPAPLTHKHAPQVLAEVGAECQADAYVPVAALGLHTKPAPVLRAVALLPVRVVLVGAAAAATGRGA